MIHGTTMSSISSSDVSQLNPRTRRAFSTDGTRYLGRDLTTPVDYKFKYDQLRRSTGVAVQWLAPSLGVFRFSYGIPLNKYTGDSANVKFPDRTENFQFTIGGSY